MQIKAYKLSSFAKGSSGGNPAGVVLDADLLTEVQMKSLANTIGFSETAFVSKSEVAAYRVRFFTPNTEIDLCGHATIAVFCLLKQKGLIKPGVYLQETKAGILRINISEKAVFMEQTQPEFLETVPIEELCSCLGVESTGIDTSLPAQIVSTGVKDILVPVRNESILKNLKPDMQKIEEVSVKYNIVGLHVFALREHSKSIAVCRNFAPLYGIPEEAATGTSNGALAAYLYRNNRLHIPAQVHEIEQGIFMDRPSGIKVMLKVKEEGIEEVWVGGEALLIGGESYTI